MASKKVIIIGGGLVGSLTACYFAKRGWTVTLYEKRPDLRLPENAGLVENRSINMTISERGYSALRRLDKSLEARVRNLSIPMHGRMIHTANKKQESHPYNLLGEHIDSLSRSILGKLLLDETQKYPSVKLYFNTKLVHTDFDTGTVTLHNTITGETATEVADLIIGADGAYSSVRQQMMAKTMVNYSQSYIEHAYVQLSLPSKVNSDTKEVEFALDPNHLHIWPRKDLMITAMPNKDKTFTCTLFMPRIYFEQKNTSGDIIKLFHEYFPDVLEMTSEGCVVSDYKTNPKGALIYVHCSPYNYKGRALIIGDAAHAMVPFYGQGMNCGFEDVELLDKILIRMARDTDLDANMTCALENTAIHEALDEFSKTRAPQAAAIVELALDNYMVLSTRVISWMYLVIKFVEDRLHKWFPQCIIPLYTMICFSSIPYNVAVARNKRQSAVIICGILVVGFTLCLAFMAALDIIFRNCTSQFMLGPSASVHL